MLLEIVIRMTLSLELIMIHDDEIVDCSLQHCLGNKGQCTETLLYIHAHDCEKVLNND